MKKITVELDVVNDDIKTLDEVFEDLDALIMSSIVIKEYKVKT